MEKRCSKCKEKKLVQLFNSDKKAKDGKRHHCKECEAFYRNNNREKVRAANKSWRDRHVKEHQWMVRKYSYTQLGLKITEEEYYALYNKQKGLCAICGVPDTETKTHCLDHCHITIKVRGFLCHKCNRGLGMFKDNFNLLLNAIKYLKNNG